LADFNKQIIGPAGFYTLGLLVLRNHWLTLAKWPAKTKSAKTASEQKSSSNPSEFSRQQCFKTSNY
jgi:hypothetical protein